MGYLGNKSTVLLYLPRLTHVHKNKKGRRKQLVPNLVNAWSSTNNFAICISWDKKYNFQSEQFDTDVTWRPNKVKVTQSGIKLKGKSV